jgi:hypothetical protein
MNKHIYWNWLKNPFWAPHRNTMHITEAFILHKKPMDRYTIFPQLFLSWQPDTPSDKRGALPDFGIGRYYDTPPFVRLQGGAEVKASIPFMVTLPPPAIVGHLPDVKDILQTCSSKQRSRQKLLSKDAISLLTSKCRAHVYGTLFYQDQSIAFHDRSA